MIALSFLLCTYHREALLVKALQSIAALRGLSAISCEIIVVDNSDAGTARACVAEFAATAPCPTRYVEAHPPSISVARNTGVAAAGGEWIAMIDDDMTVLPDWLEGLLPLLSTGQFDMMCGPVEPVFEAPDQVSPEALAFFHRTLDVPNGTLVRVVGPGRTRGFVPATSNGIFRRSACFQDAEPFKLQYGRTGGEDMDLFYRLENAGCRAGWATAAGTREFVPAHRCSFEYLEQRSLSGGQIFAAIYIRNSPKPWWTALRILVIATGQAAVAQLKAWLSPPRSAQEQRSRALQRAAIRGKLTWRTMFPIYDAEQDSLQSGRV